jgi:hypothetical protein
MTPKAVIYETSCLVVPPSAQKAVAAAYEQYLHAIENGDSKGHVFYAIAQTREDENTVCCMAGYKNNEAMADRKKVGGPDIVLTALFQEYAPNADRITRQRNLRPWTRRSTI